MKPLPRISDAEWEVMKVLWEQAPATANDVVERLQTASSWSPRTIKTLLNRLVGKKALGFEEDGRMYRYFPLVSEAECARAESRSFLNRVYGGALTPLVANFLQDQEVSQEEIAELRRLLNQKRRG
jgi:BlaI family penicillinase repressor